MSNRPPDHAIAASEDVDASVQSARKLSRRPAISYLVAADAPSTVRAYTAHWKHFSLWCAARQQVPVPATPELVGDYLSDLGEGYARATLRRKVAAIARANRLAGYALDTRDTSIRDVLRGIGRTHGAPPKRAQAFATEEVQKLVATCTNDPAGLRDRTLILIAFAGALRRSELCAIKVEHITWKPRSLELLIPEVQDGRRRRRRTNRHPAREGGATCPLRALQAWLRAVEIDQGPVCRA